MRPQIQNLTWMPETHENYTPRGPMGWPIKTEGEETRRFKVSFRVSAKERDLIRAAVLAQDEPMADMLRKVVIEGLTA